MKQAKKKEEMTDDKMHLFKGANLSSPTRIEILLLCGFVTVGLPRPCRNFHSASDPPETSALLAAFSISQLSLYRFELAAKAQS